MSHLRAEQGVAGLWRWLCAACSETSRRWYLTKEEAITLARDHSHDLHPQYH
ncbi:MAG TPA: hypothetical protein VE032_02990 [Actinomycetota bacterium]|nr:hypothetical protein [Actinomycetota bacterium]